jgi:subtilisin
MNSKSYSVSYWISRNCCAGPVRSLNSIVGLKNQLRSWIFLSVISYFLLSSVLLFSVMNQGQTPIIARDESGLIQSIGSSLIPFQDNYYDESLNQYNSITGDSLDATREMPEMPAQSRVGERIPGQYIVLLDETKISSSPNPEISSFYSKDSGSGSTAASDRSSAVREKAESIRDRLAGQVGADRFSISDVYESSIKGFAISIPDNDPKILDLLKKDPRVSVVEQDQRVYSFRITHPLLTKSLLTTGSQKLPTGINRVDGDLSSTISGNGRGSQVNADIAIIDTGIQLNHPDLNVYRQKTFVAGTSSANDDHGHGTHLAGTAAAKDNSIGVVGIAPGARLWAIKVLDKNGAGSISNVIAGIDYVTANAKQIDVVNISFGCECKSSALDSAITKSVSKGITYVVAAGNSKKDASTFSPAYHPKVISVSAISDTDGKCGSKGPTSSYGKDDSFATFSNYGSTVDISAPGVGIYSTYKGSSYKALSGTSMSASHVSGAVALYKANVNPSALPNEIMNALRSAGSNLQSVCDGNGFGYFTNDPDKFHEPLLYVRKF